MYKIDFENEQKEIVLSCKYKTIEELFAASLCLDVPSFFHIGAYTATAYVGYTVLLYTTSEDLLLEFNIKAFQDIPELYSLLLKEDCFVPELMWVKKPTSEQLNNYLVQQNVAQALLSNWMSINTTHYTTDVYATNCPTYLTYFKDETDKIYTRQENGEVFFAFDLVDYISGTFSCVLQKRRVVLTSYEERIF